MLDLDVACVIGQLVGSAVAYWFGHREGRRREKQDMFNRMKDFVDNVMTEQERQHVEELRAARQKWEEQK